MKSVLYVMALFLGSVWTDMAGECDMAGFYLELGCTAEPRADNSTGCPDVFTCPDLHPDPTMCYYRGIPYGDRSTIPQALIANPCSQACRCRVQDGEPRFECAAVDCVEMFYNSDRQQCVSTYELDACCTTGSVCGKDAIANLKTCEVDGQTFREGETFEPKNTHKTCICTGEWNGSTDGAYCRDVNCGIEIHYQDKINSNCAPVFIEDRRGCPISFTCPTPSTKVIRRLNVRGVSAQCAFGNMTLGVGDELVSDDKCSSCSCVVPPFVSCMMKNGCSE